MATISNSVGRISSAGIGSGLDVDSIVSKLVQVEQLPLQRLQSAANGLKTQLSAFGQVQSLVSSLQEAARALHNPDTFKLTNAVSSDATSVSAGTSASAAPGAYTVAVTKLASAQAVVSATGQFADAGVAVGAGTLTIQLGAWDGNVFTPKSGASAAVLTVDAGKQSLADVRDQINAANAGVTAAIVTDASGARLALTSASTGAENAFRITVSDADGNGGDAAGLSRLAYDPATAATQMTRTQQAGNAQASVNGIAISSATNTLTNVIDGLTVTLGKETTAPVTLTVSRNTDAVKTRVAGFVSAWNALNTFLGTVTKYDAETKKAALLQGDSTATGLQSQLRGLLSPASSASSAFPTLSSIGVRLGKDGMLALDDATFTKALGNLSELGKALGKIDTAVDAGDGFAKRFSEWTDKVLASGGTLPGKTQMLQKRLDANGKDQEKMADRISSVEARLKAQYTALDATMSRASALAAYVEQQFYTLPKQNSR